MKESFEKKLDAMKRSPFTQSDYFDLGELERLHNQELENVRKENVNEEVAGLLPDIQEEEYKKAVVQVRAEYSVASGKIILESSPFISESISKMKYELYPNSFIPDKPFNDPVSEETKLYLDDKNDRWLVRVKNGVPKLISRFVVIACLIVDASGPGMCRAFVVFLKGEDKPLIFWNGIIDPGELRRQTQFHQKGLSYGRKDLYHESFLRALSMCRAVYFLTLPRHAGWNYTLNGLRVFVNSGMMQPQLEGLFLKNDAEDNRKECNKNKLHNYFLDISLVKTEREYKDVVADYHTLLPDALLIKIGTVISATSRLLPHYKAEGLVQDRLWVVETSDDATAKAMIAVMQNRNHQSIEALFSSKGIPYIENEVKKYVDCVMIIRHSTAIGSKYKLDNIQELLYEIFKNTFVDDSVNRLVPVLIIDNAGVLNEELAIHQLSLKERLSIDDYEQTQRLLGELDYHIVKNIERNPDALMQYIKAEIAEAKEMAITLPRRSRSSSAIMLLSTALMMKKGKLFTDADIEAMMQWLRTEAKSRTSMGRSVCKAAGTALSEVISSGRKKITYKNGPQQWTPDSYYVAEDDSINVTKDDFDEIISELPVGRNTALKYLKAEDVLISNKGEEQKTWTVKTEDGISKTRRFYSLSRDLLSPEANRIVDEAVASDLFHKPDKHIDHFFPFIKHPRLDMYAGQVITDYKHGTPFIAVTGAQGSGKSTWLMMQVLQRAEADDLVVVMDPTNSFCREELIAHGIPIEKINKSFSFWDMSTQGWPVDILNFEDCKDITKRVQRLSSLLISGMHLTGPNQKAIVMAKVEEWLKEYEINNNLSIFNLPKRFDENADERKLKTKLDALLSTVKESGNEDQPSGWDKFLSDRGKVFVISSGDATINVEGNPFDVLFDTLYSYKDNHKDGSMTLILDEVQTFNHHKTSTLVNILSRVRKDNISVILASQDFLNASLTAVYKYCGTHILFRPLGEECIKAVAELTKLDINVIRTLPDFNCAVMGSVYSEYFKRNIQLITAIMGETYRANII